ncbi:hypothetical protein FHU29_004552 [Hoyosella altamirensis]|uniref:Uncharacterized protein n=1 Tax=Hoyosella altamirensis TaxID=616997 RepID=A0A839RUT0_9ACTN|nr:hypothetical protein [Hoyosella altamirensis]
MVIISDPGACFGDLSGFPYRDTSGYENYRRPMLMTARRNAVGLGQTTLNA